MQLVHTNASSPAQLAPTAHDIIAAWGKLPTTTRAIRSENLALLRRRHAFACAYNDAPEKITSAKWYPGQSELLDILSVCSHEDIAALADCDRPLFKVPFSHIIAPTPMSVAMPQPGSQEWETRQEVTKLLLTRLDALRINHVRASLDYDLTQDERRWLNNKCPMDVESCVSEAFMAPLLNVGIVYFHAVLARDLPIERKTLLATLSCTHHH